MENYLNKKTREKMDEIAQICCNMFNFGQRFLILEGGSAVGKTLFAKEVAKKLVGSAENRIHFFQLHEGYSYNNFVYGQQVKTNDGKIVYEKGNQPLLEIISEVESSKELHVVILDDINRCNINAVFGDLFTALESNETGNVIKTDEKDISIPENIFFIGTMNPLVGKESIDYAWFRRFTVVELKADSSCFEADESEDKDYRLFKWYAKEIFEHVNMLFELYFSDVENKVEREKYMLGQGMYLQYEKSCSLKNNLASLHSRLKYIVVPILEEYVRQGILQHYVELDIVCLKNIWGNDLELKFSDIERGKANVIISELIKDEELPNNVKFLFFLHSNNKKLKIQRDEVEYTITENVRYMAEYSTPTKVAPKQNANGIYSTRVNMSINGINYTLLAFTGPGMKLYYQCRSAWCPVKDVYNLRNELSARIKNQKDKLCEIKKHMGEN